MHVFYFILIQFAALYFEFLTFEFKKRTLQQRIEDFHGIFYSFDNNTIICGLLNFHINLISLIILLVESCNSRVFQVKSLHGHEWLISQLGPGRPKKAKRCMVYFRFINAKRFLSRFFYSCKFTLSPSLALFLSSILKLLLFPLITKC